MLLLGKPKLHELVQVYPGSKAWASGWASEVASASWKQAADILNQFPRVKEIQHGNFAFPVGDLAIDVVIIVAFPQGIAVVQDWINRDSFHGH